MTQQNAIESLLGWTDFESFDIAFDGKSFWNVFQANSLKFSRY